MPSKNDNIAAPTCLTITQLTKRWRCSRDVIYQAVDRGDLAVFQIGKRSWRVLLSEVERYEHATKKTTEAA